MLTVTMQELSDRFELKTGNSVIHFPFSCSDEKTSQQARAREYVDHANKSGANLKLKELDKRK